MGEVTSLRQAIAELVKDGDSVALEGFTHLIPTAAAHEIIRQGRRHLTLIRMTPDLIYDQMIGMGCAETDWRSNVALWGIVGIQKEAALSAKRAIVTVEEVVESFQPRPFQIVLPSVAVDAIAVVPRAAHPSYAHGYYDRDNAFYETWDPVSRDRERFREWMERHVMGSEDFGKYLESIRKEEAIKE